MSLPNPVWSDNDISVAQEVDRNPSSLSRATWNKDPAKIAVLRAMVSCQVRVHHVDYFGWDMVKALAQKSVCLLHSSSFGVEEVCY